MDVVLTELRAGIDVVNEAIKSTNRADRLVLCFDAKHAYAIFLTKLQLLFPKNRKVRSPCWTRVQ
jgi:hypothetical protein